MEVLVIAFLLLLAGLAFLSFRKLPPTLNPTGRIDDDDSDDFPPVQITLNVPRFDELADVPAPTPEELPVDQPVKSELAKRRSRKKTGQFQGDNTATGAVNEAWKAGVPPKPRKPRAPRAPKIPK